MYETFDETSYRRKERAGDLAAWHEMLLDRFAGTLEDELQSSQLRSVTW